MFFYLSIGSNICPEDNAIKIVQHLCNRFGAIYLYPFCYTKPEGMNSENTFLNSLAIIRSEDSQATIKASLNEIEILLGRNKNDPLSSTKDRPADIDILGLSKELTIEVLESQTDDYLRKVIDHKSLADLKPYGLPIGDRPATINFNDAAGKIFVVTDKVDTFKYW